MKMGAREEPVANFRRERSLKESVRNHHGRGSVGMIRVSEPRALASGLSDARHASFAGTCGGFSNPLLLSSIYYSNPLHA
jgi:hypothetical protein